MPDLNEDHKKKLIDRYVAGEATEDELLAFFGLLKADELDLLLEEHMDFESNSILEGKQASKNRNKSFLKYAAAASILLCVGWGSYYVFHKTPVKQQTAQNPIHDIAPGSNKAILTLANGKKIILTDAQNGKLAAQGTVTINKTKDGQLVYSSGSKSISQTIPYNVVETPRGGQFHITLTDGTKVWLNAASSLKYPAFFTGNERKVELTGEAYFEVVHNSKSPFRVVTNGQIVEDIGTYFNINAYNDEQFIKTTLVDGAVKVSTSSHLVASAHAIVLKPGQQSSLNGNRIAVKDVDIDNVIAWKNGQFDFDNDNLGGIMRQVSRWYNVDVVFENENLKEKALSGIVTRFANVSELLQVLERTREVKFKIDNRKITVLNK